MSESNERRRGTSSEDYRNPYRAIVPTLGIEPSHHLYERRVYPVVKANPAHRASYEVCAPLRCSAGDGSRTHADGLEDRHTTVILLLQIPGYWFGRIYTFYSSGSLPFQFYVPFLQPRYGASSCSSCLGVHEATGKIRTLSKRLVNAGF